MKKKLLIIFVFTLLVVLCACGKTETKKSKNSKTKKTDTVISSVQDGESDSDKEDTSTGNGSNQEVSPYYDKVLFASYFDMSGAGVYEDNPYDYKAHNIYANPNLGNTSGKYSGFLIDFRADFSADDTYWSLCNFYMDLTDMRNKYSSVNGGSAYCGLQRNTNNVRRAIMSFWQVEYDGNILNADLIYPEYDTNGYFDNEGSGANYLPLYQWEDDKWYRMYICCFDDSVSGHTIVEMWVKEIENGTWDKICAYDTNLYNSYFCGDMSQFMENYSGYTSNEIRSCEFANYYVRDYYTGNWSYIDTITMSIDTWFGDKKGTYEFGSTSNTVWGITCGYGPDSAGYNETIQSDYFINKAVIDYPDCP